MPEPVDSAPVPRTTGPPGTAAPALSDPAAAGRAAPGTSEVRYLLEILALCGLVITQPLLDVIGRSPDFFLFHGAGRVEVLSLVAVYTVLPPLLLWLVGVLVGLTGPVARRASHMVTLGTLLAALGVQAGKHLTPVRGASLALLAGVVGAAGAYAYRRWSVPGQLLRLTALGPPVFVLLFLFASPASAVVLPGERADAGRADQSGRVHPPVVMLVLDEFPLVSILGPDGRVDAASFPNLARLAEGSTWYRNATGVSGWTPYALPAMLTGRYPSEAQAPHHSRYPDNLFTAFGDRYDLRVQESISQLCPPSRCPDRDVARGGLPTLLKESGTLLEQILSPVETGGRDPEDAYRETTLGEAGRGSGTAPTDPRFRWSALDENQPARFTRFLADLRPGDRPALHFLHLLMPHSPWTYLPSGIRYSAPDGMPNDGDGWVGLAHQRHLAQVRYTDRLLGETLRRLEETGLYDDALVVVTSDHGVSFTPGAQGRGPEAVRRAPAEVLWVPTFVKEPGQRDGRVDDRNWEHVDLLPTIAELAGVPLSWRTDGIPASGTARPDGDKRFHEQPGSRLYVPGPTTFAAIRAGTTRPVLPARRLPELVGRPTAELPTVDSGEAATVGDLGEYARVDPGTGRLPALIHGTVAGAVPTGTSLAVALNGRIAAVVPVLDPDPGGRRFAALLDHESLFVPGSNRVELFMVTGGPTLRRLRI